MALDWWEGAGGEKGRGREEVEAPEELSALLEKPKTGGDVALSEPSDVAASALSGGLGCGGGARLVEARRVMDSSAEARRCMVSVLLLCRLTVRIEAVMARILRTSCERRSVTWSSSDEITVALACTCTSEAEREG